MLGHLPMSFFATGRPHVPVILQALFKGYDTGSELNETGERADAPRKVIKVIPWLPHQVPHGHSGRYLLWLWQASVTDLSQLTLPLRSPPQSGPPEVPSLPMTPLYKHLPQVSLSQSVHRKPL